VYQPCNQEAASFKEEKPSNDVLHSFISLRHRRHVGHAPPKTIPAYRQRSVAVSQWVQH
jgi:hypothetical protein